MTEILINRESVVEDIFLGTNLSGRVRNTDLPYSNGLLPVFEAIINSIQAIEEKDGNLNQAQIQVIIQRDEQLKIDELKPGPVPTPNIKGFVIRDNGVGFNDKNYKSFITLDSDYKSKKGCRGVGRLLWLKAFQNVEIESTYLNEGGQLKNRKIELTEKGVTHTPPFESTEKKTRTSVHLKGFKSGYSSKTKKTLESIAHDIFAHCLWYFLNPTSMPDITIIDGDNEVKLKELREQYLRPISKKKTFKIKEETFELRHVHVMSDKFKDLNHQIAYCATHRKVKEDTIAGKIGGLIKSPLVNENGQPFTYIGMVSSKYLDENVRSERTGFNIENEYYGLLADTVVSFNEIRDTSISNAEKYLKPYLTDNKEKAYARVSKFVEEKAPRYRPILGRIPKEDIALMLECNDKELELSLHRSLAQIENELISEGHDIYRQLGSASKKFKKELSEYLEKIDDIKKSDLASYVSQRKMVLDLLEKAMRKQRDGNYANEEIIHNLLIPMRVTSDDILNDNNNLWIIDERLAFHNYMASDKPIRTMPITGSQSPKRPDIAVLNIYDNPLLTNEDPRKVSLASITIIEFKKPMRNDNEDPIEQATDYLRSIREGQVKTSDGRQIPESKNIPGFCYVICDLNPYIRKKCQRAQLIATSDNLGYFGHMRDPDNCYMNVISYDRLVEAAKQRNRAFFDKLGLPTT